MRHRLSNDTPGISPSLNRGKENRALSWLMVAMLTADREWNGPNFFLRELSFMTSVLEGSGGPGKAAEVRGVAWKWDKGRRGQKHEKNCERHKWKAPQLNLACRIASFSLWALTCIQLCWSLKAQVFDARSLECQVSFSSGNMNTSSDAISFSNKLRCWVDRIRPWELECVSSAYTSFELPGA